MSGPQPEGRIRRAVVDYLSRGGWWCFPIVQSALSYKGISDLVAIRGGRVVWIEVKTETGRLSDHQKAFGRRMVSAGGEYVVARSTADVEHLVGSLLLEPDGRENEAAEALR